MKNIDYVIFDYNGTLTDDAEIGWKTCNRLLSELYGLPKISLERFKETFGTSWIEFFVLNGVDRKNIDIPKHQKLYQETHIALTKNELKLRPGARRTLYYLKNKGLKLGVLSSRNIEDLTNELRQLEIFDLFDAVVGEDNIHEDGVKAEKKTDKLIQLLGIKNFSGVLYIGDMIQDADIARKYGFVSGLISGGWQSVDRLRLKNPDHLFSSYDEIESLFR